MIKWKEVKKKFTKCVHVILQTKMEMDVSRVRVLVLIERNGKSERCVN